MNSYVESGPLGWLVATMVLLAAAVAVILIVLYAGGSGGGASTSWLRRHPSLLAGKDLRRRHRPQDDPPPVPRSGAPVALFERPSSHSCRRTALPKAAGHRSPWPTALRGHLIPGDTGVSLGGEVFAIEVPQFTSIGCYRSASWLAGVLIALICLMPGGS